MLLRIADDKKAADDPTIINQVPPYDLSNTSFIALIVLLFSFFEFGHSPGITDTIQKMKIHYKFANNAIINIILATLGQNALLLHHWSKMITNKKKAVSSANQSTFILIDLFAKRFIPTTDKEKNETHKDGTLFVSISNSSKNAFIFKKYEK